MDAFHAQFPSQPTLGTETASTVSTRGIYENDPVKGYVSAYDRNFPPWASTAETWWKLYAERPWVAGGFAWTGFDYRGEPTPYDRSPSPCISSHFGILDTCGFPKDNFYYYQAWWTDTPVLHLFPHWNWAGKDGEPIEVWCHSNLDAVELFLNGRSLGVQTVVRYSHVAWNVPYAPGTLEARGLRNGRVVLTSTRETTGPAASIRLQADRDAIAADGEDVSVVEVQVVDERGRLVPTADNAIAFRVAGRGRILGVGNGDPSSHEPDRAESRRAFNGLCMAIVQSTFEAGEIRVEAASAGLAAATAVIRAVPVTRRPALG
jgi:beta-galactosidase